ncbi:HDR106Wp [Eremothecium sinecaudum]|uniref:HDR106Wp n=1 Tax=Eremothecium sinecaudum TaxID=45286 RepID=A0A109UZB9_9SACH|nr:HDR106Wp [Eremothecium sinecaudum]AMD20848.1 HDR106Wp [Eremothecium sinecaudum]
MCSVRKRFDELLKSIEKLDSSGRRQNSVEYQQELNSLISNLLECKQIVYDKLALFSDNESLEDLATSSIPFLSLDYHLGQLLSRKQYITSNENREPSNQNKWKLEFIKKAVQVSMQFLMALYDYDLLDASISKVIDKLEDKFNPKYNELYPQPKSAKDIMGAQMNRSAKIKMFQREKEVAAQLAACERERLNSNENEEVLRELYLTQLKHTALKCFHDMEGLLMEMELLTNLKVVPVEETQEPVEERKLRPFEYTDKVETLNKPLLSKHGKVLRNFTLLDKRNQLKDKVFGYGQYGPTMTVEEFLDKEFESGRVLQGGEEPEEEPDEDNEEWNDKEVYKAREWDEFKEANPRGSGNRLNNG